MNLYISIEDKQYQFYQYEKAHHFPGVQNIISSSQFVHLLKSSTKIQYVDFWRICRMSMFFESECKFRRPP